MGSAFWKLQVCRRGQGQFREAPQTWMIRGGGSGGVRRGRFGLQTTEMGTAQDLRACTRFSERTWVRG